MKIFISLPLSRKKLAQRMKTAEAVRKLLTARGHTAVTPFDICPDPDEPYSEYIPQYAKAVMECEAVFNCNGWELSKGCRFIQQCAEIFEKKVFNNIKEVPWFPKT